MYKLKKEKINEKGKEEREVYNTTTQQKVLFLLQKLSHSH